MALPIEIERSELEPRVALGGARAVIALVVGVGLAAVLAAGCGAAMPYAFVPADPGVAHAVPAERPRGTVRVAVVGADPTGLDVRITVAHDGDGPAWTVDLRAQHLLLRREGTLGPELAAGAGGGSPIVVIPPRSSAVIELHFALPGCTDRGRTLRAFDVAWQVDAGRVLHGVDRFERVDLAPDPVYAELAGEAGW
jgi:hypothetical protein